jgi:hypothetical protein
MKLEISNRAKCGGVSLLSWGNYEFQINLEEKKRTVMVIEGNLRNIQICKNAATHF